ncbi:MAG: 50S ribosomal protein L4 [Hyphomicrobiales bacterium]|nr:50S ribosomal protein L4 [Rickettsiales bacterium]MCP5361899.1 50S ribosomal protein L4 [Hyphomicrobiales bacterium]
MKTSVITLENKKASDIDLNDAIFGLELRKDILHRVVQWQLAKRRAGTHSTKTISEISGTTKKPFKQKGTGRARQGSMRSAQMRGGSTTFGPKPRDYTHSLPKKIRKLGLKIALSQKAAEGKLRIVDTLVVKKGKTKDMVNTLNTLGLTSALFVRGDNAKDDFTHAVSNIPYMDVLPEGGLNVYDILRHDTLVLTTHAVKSLEERLA